MGALFRAHDPVLDREVAIKTMLVDFAQDEDGRARFYREARAVARLQHRNIVTLFDFGEDQGSPYIVMEFLVGQTIAEAVRAGTQMSVERIADIGAQLCTGLHFAHLRGVVHRDIKPPNIWLNDDGNVKLLDFGIAKFGDTTVTRIGGVVGSVSYMSPEQVSGSEDVDGRSDIFSVGIVLYELLCGRRPFRADSPTGIMMKIVNDPAPPMEVPGLPPQLVNVIFRALEKDRAKRYQHANEMAMDLRAMTFASGSWHARPHESGGRVAPRPAPGNSAAAAAAAASVATPPPDTLGPEQETGNFHATPRGRSSPDHSIDSISRSWSLGTAEDLVADAVITPAEAMDAVPSAAETKARSAQARTSGEWLARWPTLALAASVAVVAGLSYSLFLRPAAPAPDSNVATNQHATPPTPNNGSTGTQTKASNPAGDPAKGSTGSRPSTGESTPSLTPLPPTGGESAGTPRAETSTDVHVLLTGPYPFSVLDENGRSISGEFTRHDLRVPAKTVLQLVGPTVHLKQRVTVDNKPGGTVRLQAPATGTLNVRSGRETCKVFLNESPLYYPPIANLRVAAGRYRLTLNCPEGDSDSQIITVTAGQTETATFR
jgi:serine/threonine protein kinase